jgi:hypothetical protein
MFDVRILAERISAEFSSAAERDKKLLGEDALDTKQSQDRLEQLGKAFEGLREVWKPRLELLVKEFGNRVKAVVHVVPSMRYANFYFQSSSAHVALRFTAMPDRDFQNVILSYLLEITPAVVHFRPYAHIEFPLNAIDKAAAAKWIDDRIIDFVRTYLSMGEPEICPKDQMVEDPVARIRFPKFAAATTLERKGETFYFISEETRRTYEAG